MAQSAFAWQGDPAEALGVGLKSHSPLLHACPSCAHVTHWLPPKPHALGVMFAGVTQTLFWQQPGQLVELHSGATQLPFWQTLLPEQVMQAAPLIPHWVLLGVVHVPAAQQPVGQLLMPQAAGTQLPLTQDSPVPQPTQAFPF
jgi:hypothetical protein